MLNAMYYLSPSGMPTECSVWWPEMLRTPLFCLLTPQLSGSKIRGYHCTHHGGRQKRRKVEFGDFNLC